MTEHEGSVRGDHSQEGDDQARRWHHPDYQASRPHSQHSSNLGRETINLPGGRLAKVRYARIATKFRSAAK
jgi:hypothetical protein